MSSVAEWTWSINNMADVHSLGFWGPVQANHAFCEPHYAVSPYIAEFFNSTSSIIYILLACCIRFPNDKLLAAAQLWLGAVGLGSMLFHGTMRYMFQLTDEVPMVGFLCTLMVAKISTPHPWVRNDATRHIANALVILFSMTLMCVYVVMDEYEIFVHGFTVMVLGDTFLTLTLMDWRSKLQRRAYAVSFFGILLGRVGWELEHILCPEYPSVWPLHVVWHVLSCLSAYGAMVNAYVMRADKGATLPRFVGFGDCIATQESKVD